MGKTTGGFDVAARGPRGRRLSAWPTTGARLKHPAILPHDRSSVGSAGPAHPACWKNPSHEAVATGTGETVFLVYRSSSRKPRGSLAGIASGNLPQRKRRALVRTPAEIA